MKADTAAPGGPVEDLRTALRALADPVRADQQRTYLHSELTHLGVRIPDLRRCVIDARRTMGALPGPDALALARDLWSPPESDAIPVYEYRRAAVEVLVQYQGSLNAEALKDVEDLLRGCRTWALVDPLAVHCAGAVALRDPAAGPVLDRWITDPDFWLRRSALLALIPGIRAGRPDPERLTRYADIVVGEREFFLRKALGWVLREASTHHPQLVIGWLDRHGGNVAPLTRREALRRLTK
ncbi:DNA alkylation repair protein [Streptomyces sp. APSN-46.1]|uniref:DNA alkylation repair protein n=1 Tax=Streptomyces sp. APSN-46.1 TaxID=2929049 RepID=UPI001FB51E57|nr:DNA alkylation repair protein [Streptomyces sp. APSN-46.1]MCJ1676393.1 DNA alkylation repair protein [Streptomyces sp. APSN-46.1]